MDVATVPVDIENSLGRRFGGSKKKKEEKKKKAEVNCLFPKCYLSFRHRKALLGRGGEGGR